MDEKEKAEITVQTEHVITLIQKAGKAKSADDALKYSQAALNAANAILGLTGRK